MTQIEEFNYHLPKELIAQHSILPRDHSRLMVLDRQTGKLKHKKFFEIVDELKEGDVLVFNDTKVFRARMIGKVGNDREVGKVKAEIEIFLLRARENNVWETMARPGRKVQVGQTICLEYGIKKLCCEVFEKKSDGIVLVKFDRAPEDVIVFANEYGEIPIPPYVKNKPERLEDYQTIYAKEAGSVAAPTAGFHFTENLMEKLKSKGVQFEFVTLHVGIGTFRPMKTATIEEHEMHSEFVSISKETADRINQAKKEKRRVIAVGTTTVRTLEGVASSCCHPEPFDFAQGKLREGSFIAFTGDVNLFIKPGFDFKIIDGLITNFHLPKSTLLVLVSAFVGRENVLRAYKEAVAQKYRFFSFGDAMFIV
ncbi:tRNA preQ1(34) S-adenosylmethionine ribosyltransferase-isomerase QueA [Candidatus Uhrbacteria bacterium]|nr:tRNA preQ1(34) S-adenosylmethionine ribosyltransferase-isomerase QueA [Candidatus Uhrbacteria bacterium]